MFDKIGDMPLHPLVIHAVVFGIPLAVLLALLFAFPRTREWARWPLAIVVVGATAVTFVARQSGLAFEAALGIKPGNPVGDLILQHSLLANQLFYIMIVFAAIGLINVFVVRKSTAEGAAKQPAIIRIVLPILLVAAALVALIWIVRVGDLGARAVWNPTAPPLFNFP
jgi:hypothetical protein